MKKKRIAILCVVSIAACWLCTVNASYCNGCARGSNGTLRPPASNESQQVPVYNTRGTFSESSYVRGVNSGAVRLAQPMSMVRVVAHLRANPYDLLMIAYVNDAAMQDNTELLEEAFRQFAVRPTPILAGIMMIAAERQNVEALEAIRHYTVLYGTEAFLDMIRAHPSVNVRVMADRELYRATLVFEAVFELNRAYHALLETTEEAVPVALPVETIAAAGREMQRTYVPIADIVRMMPRQKTPSSYNTGTGLRVRAPSATVERLLPLIHSIGGRLDSFSAGAMHGCAVSWSFERTITAGANRYEVRTMQVAGGKGLDEVSAQASGLAEAVERYSAMVASTPDWPQGYQEHLAIRYGSASDLQAQGLRVLDLNTATLTYPYRDQRLHWVNAVLHTEHGQETVYVPVQMVFLDTNFSEPEVIGNGSNGFASGNTLPEARLHALLEIVERDGDYTMFYSPARCFRLTSRNREINTLLRLFRTMGVEVEVLDLTTEFGVPTYRVYAQGEGGMVMSGSGAHLDGRIAMTRALCEFAAKLIAYNANHAAPFTQHPARAAAARRYETLPNYSSGNIEQDLVRVESLLRTNGYSPIYVNLTRADWQFPVVRAIVPGLEICQGVASARRVVHFLQALGAAHANTGTASSFSPGRSA